MQFAPPRSSDDELPMAAFLTATGADKARAPSVIKILSQTPANKRRSHTIAMMAANCGNAGRGNPNVSKVRPKYSSEKFLLLAKIRRRNPEISGNCFEAIRWRELIFSTYAGRMRSLYVSNWRRFMQGTLHLAEAGDGTGCGTRHHCSYIL